MPFITITVKESTPTLNLKQVAEDIGSATGIAPERVNLVVNSCPAERYFRGSGSESPVIQIAARSQNGQAWIQALMRAAADAVAGQLKTDPAALIVYVNPIEDGYFLAGGTMI